MLDIREKNTPSSRRLALEASAQDSVAHEKMPLKFEKILKRDNPELNSLSFRLSINSI